ncbi:MAG: hypothetical protein HQL50_00475 [Magnetococcales bacterium]|nr:hypothetical protein [Magnetococcales bacterium]
MNLNTPLTVCALVCGTKGANFLEDTIEFLQPTMVYTYRQKGEGSDYLERINSLSQRYGFQLEMKNRPSFQELKGYDLCFVVGWQFLLPTTENLVIFHDSPLPRYRGFSPTVSQLLNEEPCLGVTALLPSEEPDQGPILAQSLVDISYPITLQEALTALRSAYSACAKEVFDCVANGNPLVGQEQDETQATYSIWRNEEDMWVDWEQDAQYITRFVNALGPPYSGAKTACYGRTIILNRVEPGPEMTFEQRTPGKFWSIRDNIPLVICGRGTLRILQAQESSGEPVNFTVLRARLSKYR